MDALIITLVSVGIGLILGSYGYTYLVQRDISTLDKAWTKTAEAMRTARDDQVGRIRSDMTTAISDINIRLYDHKLFSANNYATNESVDRLRSEMLVRFDKLDVKMDNLTSFMKGGGDRR